MPVGGEEKLSDAFDGRVQCAGPGLPSTVICDRHPDQSLSSYVHVVHWT